MEEPLVSVVIPVGPAHVAYVQQAVASVRWSSVADRCEIIVVNDSGRAQLMSGRAQLMNLDTDLCLATSGQCGPAHARNLGLQAARAPFVVFLDADDYLLPGGVEALLRGYAESDVGYVYGDVYTTIEAPGTSPNIGRTPDYDQRGFASYNLHVVTALVPTGAARYVGGFDEAVEGFEDWTLYLRLAIAGICGKRISAMTMVYRTGLGERAKEHGKSGEHARVLMDQVLSRYQNDRGVIEMASCCGGDAPLQGIAAQAVAELPGPAGQINGPDGTVRMEFVGPERGSVTYRSPQTGQSYRLGNNTIERYANVAQQDVAWLMSVADVRVVPPIAPYVSPPAAEQAITPEQPAVALRPARVRKVET